MVKKLAALFICAAIVLSGCVSEQNNSLDVWFSVEGIEVGKTQAKDLTQLVGQPAMDKVKITGSGESYDCFFDNMTVVILDGIVDYITIYPENDNLPCPDSGIKLGDSLEKLLELIPCSVEIIESDYDDTIGLEKLAESNGEAKCLLWHQKFPEREKTVPTLFLVHPDGRYCQYSFDERNCIVAISWSNTST